VSQELVDIAHHQISQAGYRVRITEHLLSRSGQFAGTDSERVADFLSAWQDPEVKAIWAVRGGYGAQRMVDAVASELDTQAAKWFIGFSDSTSIHGLLQRKGLQSIHGPMISTLTSTATSHVAALFDILAGQFTSLSWKPHTLNHVGKARGRLVGGNLSVLQTMVGTPTQPIESGDILFIEDLDEMLYHLDRMMLHMRRTALLESLGGILIGGMSDMRDNTLAHGFSIDNPFGQDAHSIISERLAGLDIPIAYNLPCGHGQENHPLILGAQVNVQVNQSGGLLEYV